ncbi:mitochondrial 37S ribosomal protein mS23 [Ascoidea rubescens DSM 1968]|uniref:37S ribosomal protein S25, mitochondrial n=1 Tax=Ascoidea rubescens DSM 1968 TaxID=1344418 RepID=A0A1D2VG88_9ASCO|nr:mitochondrial ribosomal protein [Ascoidea rubescens DSM 1968]ODV60635.1 mitochondrial ribosomal protein [Ascoidea rubescens DSM 1968]
MKLERKALNVLETASHAVNSGLLSKQPVWMPVVAAHPPLKDLIRVPYRLNKLSESRNQDSKTKTKNSNSVFKTNNKDLKPANLYKPSNLNFLADELRSLFYKQHPWELANPKLVVENANGDDNISTNYSSILNVGKALDGEAVVQRSLYIKENSKDLSLLQCYDQARFEFYQAKIHRELAANVAKEEALMAGAVFGKSHIEIGFEQEQNIITQWKKDATFQTKVLDSSKSFGVSQNSSANNLENENKQKSTDEPSDVFNDEYS